jgi:peptidyl-prolyl cis-trans isomerase C
MNLLSAAADVTRLKLVLALGASLALAVSAADKPATNGAAPAADAPLFDDPVVARGQGVEVRRSQVDEAFIALKANLAVRGQTIPEPLRQLREAQLLDRLILNRLLGNRATDADRARGKEIAAKLLAESKKEFPNEEAFFRRIKALGLTAAQFNQRVQDQALADAVIERELKAKLAVTDAQVKEFYEKGADVLAREMEAAVARMANDPNTTIGQLGDTRKQIDEVRKQNLARLEQPEKVRVSHIFLSLRDRQNDVELSDDQKKAKRRAMDRLLERAKTGEDFAKLVLENSEDRGLVETKGEYTLSRDDPFVPEFKAAAFTLQTNQISDVVVTPYGYHLIKLLEKIPARKMDFDKAAPEIKDFLLSQELQKAMPDYFVQVKKDARVEILDPRYQIVPPKEAAATPGAK